MFGDVLHHTWYKKTIAMLRLFINSKTLTMGTSTGLLLVIVGVFLTVCDASSFREMDEFDYEAISGIVKPSLQCGATSSDKYIRIGNESHTPNRCYLYIRPYSRRVRQLRIDFKLRMVPPTLPTWLQYYYRLMRTLQVLRKGEIQSMVGASCKVDFVNIGDFRFCGREGQQHIYVPFNGDDDDAEFMVYFYIEAQRRGYNYTSPAWELNITQVELLENCQQPLVYQFITPSAHCDPLLAPQTCTQYFTEPKGVVSSFNFDKGRGFYLPKDYVICFKKPHASAVLRLNVTNFKLGYRGYPPTEITSEYCPLCERDYMVIRGKITGGTLLTQISPQELNDQINYFSGRILEGYTLDVSKEGTPVIRFDTGHQNTRINTGFQFSYEFI